VGLGTRGVGALALGLTLLGAGGCATRSADWVFDVRAANAPSRVPPGADDTVLLNIIASIITHDLGLPLPAAVPAVAYGDEASFTSGLERRGVGSERAQEAARLSSAVANGAGIFLRSDVLRGMSTTDRARERTRARSSGGTCRRILQGLSSASRSLKCVQSVRRETPARATTRSGLARRSPSATRSSNASTMARRVRAALAVRPSTRPAGVVTTAGPPGRPGARGGARRCRTRSRRSWPA